MILHLILKAFFQLFEKILLWGFWVGVRGALRLLPPDPPVFHTPLWNIFLPWLWAPRWASVPALVSSWALVCWVWATWWKDWASRGRLRCPRTADPEEPRQCRSASSAARPAAGARSPADSPTPGPSPAGGMRLRRRKQAVTARVVENARGNVPSLFVSFKANQISSLNTQNRQLKTTQSVSGIQNLKVYFLHAPVTPFLLFSTWWGTYRKSPWFLPVKKLQEFKQTNKNQRFSGAGDGGRARSDGTPLAFLLQVVLARLGGGHHVGCHLVDLARRLLEDWQPLTAAARLHLRAQDKRL